MTDSKAMRPLLALLLVLAAASASAAPPVVEKEADWRWLEEPRNAHNYRQGIKKITKYSNKRNFEIHGIIKRSILKKTKYQAC